MHADDEITIIEGLANGDDLHPMQMAFVRRDALQCGYCTPGQICSAVAVLAEHKAGWPSYATTDVAIAPDLTHAEISEPMSGNICRCSAYPNKHRCGDPRRRRGEPHMKSFRYERASGIASACVSAAKAAAKFIAGGTNLVDLMKLEIETPAQLVDINALPLRGIEETPEHGMRIGAQVTKARSPPTCGSAATIPCCLRRSWPVRPELRNKATTGGNLLGDAVSILLRHDQALQQTRARLRFRGLGGLNRMNAVMR